MRRRYRAESWVHQQSAWHYDVVHQVTATNTPVIDQHHVLISISTASLRSPRSDTALTSLCQFYVITDLIRSSTHLSMFPLSIITLPDCLHTLLDCLMHYVTSRASYSYDGRPAIHLYML